MRKLFFCLSLLLFFMMADVNAIWWNSSWDYKKEIPLNGIGLDVPDNYQFKIEVDYITDHMNSTFKDLRFTQEYNIYETQLWVNESSSGALTDYQAKITITNTTIIERMLSDGSDIRMYDGIESAPYDQSSNISFWVESIAYDELILWVKVNLTANENKTIYMYYGNPTAESESNGTATFDWFDDFEDNDVSDWTQDAGANFVSQNSVVKSGSYSGKFTYTSSPDEAYKTFSAVDRQMFEFDLRVSSSSADSYFILEKTSGDLFNSEYIIFRTTGNIETYDGAFHVMQSYSINTWYHFKIITNANSNTFTIYIDDVLKGTDLGTRGTTAPTITAFSFFGGTASNNFYSDNFISRKYTATEPTTGIKANSIQSTENEVEIDYWVETNVSETNATVWLEVPETSNSTNTTVYMYYGNPTAESESNINNTMVLGDDFTSGSIDTSLWNTVTNNGGTLTVTDGVVHASVTASTVSSVATIYSKISYGTSYILTSKMKFGNTGNHYQTYSHSGFGTFESGAGYMETIIAGDDGIYFRDVASSNNNWYYGYDIDASGTVNIGETVSTSYKIFTIERYSTNTARWLIDDVQVLGATSTIADSVPIVVGIDGQTSNAVTDANDLYIDYVFVRKYTTTEPTYSIGAEETSNTAPTVTLNSPIDDSTNTSKTVSFGFTPTDNAGFTSCSLWTNETSWSEKETNTSAITNNSINTITETFTSDGTYLWNVKCIDSGSLSAFASNNWTISMDSTAPTITIDSPENTTYDTSSIDLNWSANEILLDAWYSLNGGGNVSLFDFDNVGHIDNGGAGQGVWSDGTYIYLANHEEGIRAYTFNGTDFDNVGHIDNGAYGYDVWSDGTYIYLANHEDGIRAYTFNGTDFDNVGHIDNGGYGWGVWGDGTYIYLSNYDDGVRAYTFNGTDFDNVGHIYNDGYGFGVWGDGTYIYMANFLDGIRAYTFNGTDFDNVGHIDNGGVGYDVWGDGTYIYLANEGDGIRAYTFNGTDFDNVGHIDNGGAGQGVWSDSTYIYLANHGDGIRAYTKFSNTTIIATQGSNNVTVYANDSVGNVGGETEYFTVDTTAPNCTFISQTPSELNTSSSGRITILYNCTDATGINNTRIGLAHTVNYTIENNLNYSWRYPSNTLADGFYFEQRAEHRNENKWFDVLFDNIYEWGFHAIGLNGDYIEISDNGTYPGGYWYLINYTRNELQGVYNIDYPLDKSTMESSIMNSLNVYQNNLVLSEFHIRKIKANTTMQLHIYSEDTNAPQDELLYYCNSSKKTDGFAVDISPNCVYFSSIDRTDEYAYSVANVHYYNFGCYIDANKKIGGIVATEISYIAEMSQTPLTNAWKSMYSDDTTLFGNISLNNTNTIFTSSDDGVSFTAHNGTRVMWFSRIHENFDEVVYKSYICDSVFSNNCGWSIIQTSPIGVLPQAPETPQIIHIDGDKDLNGTYSGIFNIGVFLGLDPNGDLVTGNLTLRNTDGSFNYIINGGFSDSGKEINVSFDSRLVLNGDYKLQLENCDPTVLCSSTLLHENFTLNDTTPPQNLVLNLPYNTDHTNDNQANFSWSIDYEPNVSFDLIILNATDNSTILNKTGITNQYYQLLLSEELADYDYYWYVVAYDINDNSVETGKFYLVIDTVIPHITLFDYPKFDNSTIVGGYFNLDVLFDDLYLFAVQVNITNSTGGLMWNKTVVNLTTESYTLNDSIDSSSWSSGIYTIKLYAEDDHTAKVIPDYDVTRVVVQNKLMFNTHSSMINIIYDKNSGTQEVVEDFTYEKLTDRYVFTYDYSDSGVEKTYRFKLQSNKVLYYRENLYDYPAFVTGDNWVDFNLVDDAEYIVERQTDHLYYITVITDSSKLRFQSLGGLNNVTETYTFTVDNSAPVISFVSPTPVNDSVVWVTEQTITVTSDEYLNNSEVRLEIDSMTNYTMNSINDTYYDYDINFTNGTHTFKVYGYDLVANMGVSETRTIQVDLLSPPEFIIASPLNISYNALSIDLDIVNLGRPVTEWYYSVDYSNWSLFTPNTTLIGFEYNGVYQLDILAVGNNDLNSTESVYFTINYTGLSYFKNLTCASSNTHYISINPLDDDDLRWSCELDTDEDYYCVTHIYGNDEFNAKDEMKLIQTNPKRTNIKRYGIVDYFKSTGSYANVYFTDERLMAESNYTYEVECTSTSGKDYGYFVKPITIEYRQMANSMALGVFGIQNMGYLIGMILLIFMVLFIFMRGVKRA